MGQIPGVATVGFLHVAAAHVQAARRLLAEHAPGVVDIHVVDRSLLGATGDVSTRIAARGSHESPSVRLPGAQNAGVAGMVSPKSISLTSPVFDTIRFCGETSRWTIPKS